MTFAVLCKFLASIGDEIDPDLPSSEDAPIGDHERGKNQKRAKYQNVVAVTQLASAFSTDTALLFLYEGMSDAKWPNGLAYLMVKAIKKQYMPNGLILKVELQQAELFNQLSEIKVKFNQPGQLAIEKDEFIAVVVTRAPDIYQGVLTSEQQRKANDVTLADLQETMTMQYQAMGGRTKENKEDSEVTLTAFGGTCYHCKQHGHKAHECPKVKRETKEITEEQTNVPSVESQGITKTNVG